MLALRNRLESGLKAISPHAVNFSEAAGRLPNTTLFAVEGMKAETAVIAFGLEGIAVSSGAACSSGKAQPSHVLAATEICARARRGAREPGLEHRRGRYRTLSCRLEKACKCAM
jgi:cysteine desulfurase